MMGLTSRLALTFDGHCEAAFQLYERCLGGKITFLLRWGDSPLAKDAPAEWAGKINHASIEIGDMKLAGGDVLSGTYERPRGFSILLGTKDVEETHRIFEALAENGTVRMPLQQTFWSKCFGDVVDQFGIAWSINCEGK